MRGALDSLELRISNFEGKGAADLELLEQTPGDACVGAVLVVEEVLDERRIDDQRSPDLPPDACGDLIRPSVELRDSQTAKRTLGNGQLHGGRCSRIQS